MGDSLRAIAADTQMLLDTMSGAEALKQKRTEAGVARRDKAFKIDWWWDGGDRAYYYRYLSEEALHADKPVAETLRQAREILYPEKLAPTTRSMRSEQGFQRVWETRQSEPVVAPAMAAISDPRLVERQAEAASTLDSFLEEPPLTVPDDALTEAAARRAWMNTVDAALPILRRSLGNKYQPIVSPLVESEARSSKKAAAKVAARATEAALAAEKAKADAGAKDAPLPPATAAVIPEA